MPRLEKFQDMELFSRKIKKFLIFREMEFLSPRSRNEKKKKKSPLKKFIFFFLKKAFVILRETEHSYIVSKKLFLYFRQWNCQALYFSNTSGSNFPSSKNEKKKTAF